MAGGKAAAHQQLRSVRATWAACVAGEVVHDDDVARRQRGSEELLDIGLESRRVHGTVEHEWSHEPVEAQASDKGCRLPMAERDAGAQPFSLGSAAVATRHVG